MGNGFVATKKKQGGVVLCENRRRGEEIVSAEREEGIRDLWVCLKRDENNEMGDVVVIRRKRESKGIGV